MFTKEELITILKKDLELIENRKSTQEKFKLDDESYYPFMCGYLSGDIKLLIAELS